jgi:hypothetical protein
MFLVTDNHIKNLLEKLDKNDISNQYIVSLAEDIVKNPNSSDEKHRNFVYSRLMEKLKNVV